MTMEEMASLLIHKERWNW